MYPVCLLLSLCSQLRERNVFNTGEQVEEGGMGVLLRLIDLPTVEGLSSDTIYALRKHLLSASIRIQVAVAWVSNFSHIATFLK